MARIADAVSRLRDEEITEEEHRLLRVVTGMVAVAALATIPVTAAELNSSTSAWIPVADWSIWAVFFVEWVLMLVFPPKAGGFVGQGALDRRNWRDWRNWVGIAILVISFPLLYPAFQFVRLVRVVRLARVGRVVAVTMRALGDTLGRRGVLYVGGLVTSAIILGGVLMSSIEPQTVGGHDVWSGIWWATTTTIATGFGGTTPQTAEGRTITMVLMLCGVAFVTTLAGSIAAYFLGQRDLALPDDMRRKLDEIHAAVADRTAAGNADGPIVEPIGDEPQLVRHPEGS